MAAKFAQRAEMHKKISLPRQDSLSTGAESQHLRGKPSGVKIHLRVLGASNIPTVEMSSPKTFLQLQFRDDRPQRTSVVRSPCSSIWGPRLGRWEM